VTKKQAGPQGIDRKLHDRVKDKLSPVFPLRPIFQVPGPIREPWFAGMEDTAFYPAASWRSRGTLWKPWAAGTRLLWVMTLGAGAMDRAKQGD